MRPHHAPARATPWPALDIQVPRHPERVAQARHVTRVTLTSWGVAEEATDVVVLVVSELVTNAVRHARSAPGREIGLRVALGEARHIRVEVSDAGNGLPRLRTADLADESSRGLTLVAALALRHGVAPRPHGVGKTAWADIDASPGG